MDSEWTIYYSARCPDCDCPDMVIATDLEERLYHEDCPGCHESRRYDMYLNRRLGHWVVLRSSQVITWERIGGDMAKEVEGVREWTGDQLWQRAVRELGGEALALVLAYHAGKADAARDIMRGDVANSYDTALDILSEARAYTEGGV